MKRNRLEMAELALLEFGSATAKPSKLTQIVKDEISIGRQKDSDVCLPSISISRKHCSLRLEDQQWYIIDKNSANHVFVNNLELKPDSEHPLNDGDIVQLGQKPKPDGENSEYFVYEFRVNVPSKKRKLESDTADVPPKCHPCDSPRVSQTAGVHDHQQMVHLPQERDQKENDLLEQHAQQQKELLEQRQQELEQRAQQQKEMEQLLRQQEELKQLLEQQQLLAEHTRQQSVLEERVRQQEELLASMAAKEELLKKEMKALQTEQNHREEKLKLLEEQLTITEKEKEAKIEIQEVFSEIMETELQCSICSELFIKPKILPCSHAFCGYCIDKWLEKKKECPNCRLKVTKGAVSHLLENYIERALVTLPADKRDYRKAIILSREAEVAQQQKPSSKGKQKRAASRQPSVPSAAINDGGLNQRASTSRASASSAGVSRMVGGTPAVASPSISNTSPASGTRRALALQQNVSLGRTAPSGTVSARDPDVEFVSETPVPGASNDIIIFSTTAEPVLQVVELISSDSDDASDHWCDSSSDSYQWGNDDEDGSSDSLDRYDGPYTGLPGRSYGGYGRCYNCGGRGHWRPGCPFR